MIKRAYALLALSVAFAVFGAGYAVANWRRDSAELSAADLRDVAHTKALAELADERDAALRLTDELRGIGAKVVYRDIEKVVAGADCARLGPDFVELFERMHSLDANAGSLLD